MQQFTHTTEEHYNKFFNRTQLGILAQDLAEVMPEAVASVPERRYVDALGASKVTKDVLMIRDSQCALGLHVQPVTRALCWIHLCTRAASDPWPGGQAHAYAQVYGVRVRVHTM